MGNIIGDRCRSQADATLRAARDMSLGGPQIPSPVRRIAPKPRRCTEISPPSKISPAALAESSFLFLVASKIRPLSSSHTDHQAFISFASWRSHKFRSDWIVDCFPQDCIYSSEVAFR
jgi:hypothetical protein